MTVRFVHVGYQKAASTLRQNTIFSSHPELVSLDHLVASDLHYKIYGEFSVWSELYFESDEIAELVKECYKKDDNNNIPPITNSFGTSYPKDSPGWRAFAKTRGELNNQFDSMVEGRNEEDY